MNPSIEYKVPTIDLSGFQNLNSLVTMIKGNWDKMIMMDPRVRPTKAVTSEDSVYILS